MDEKSAGDSGKAKSIGANTMTRSLTLPANAATRILFPHTARRRRHLQPMLAKSLRKLKTTWRLVIKSTTRFRLFHGMKCVRLSNQPGINWVA